jgi:hypothetical protein
LQIECDEIFLKNCMQSESFSLSKYFQSPKCPPNTNRYRLNFNRAACIKQGLRNCDRNGDNGDGSSGGNGSAGNANGGPGGSGLSKAQMREQNKINIFKPPGPIDKFGQIRNPFSLKTIYTMPEKGGGSNGGVGSGVMGPELLNSNLVKQLGGPGAAAMMSPQELQRRVAEEADVPCVLANKCDPNGKIKLRALAEA